MIRKLLLLNILRSKYFYLITVLSAWLLVLVFHFNAHKGPFSSLQLSSLATPAIIAVAPSGSDLTEIPDLQPKYYDLHLRLLQNRSATHVVVNSENENIAPELRAIELKKKTVVTVTVPASAFGEGVDPTKLRESQVSLSQILTNVPLLENDIPHTMGARQEATISATDRRARQLIGESVRVDLRAMAASGALKLVDIKENEDVDYGADDEDVADATIQPPLLEGTQAGVACASGICNDVILPKNTFNIVNWALDLLPKPKTIFDIVSEYTSSKEVEELMATARNGYPARNKKGQRRTPREGRVSGSIGACYNGVKAFLARGGMIGATTDLAGGSAVMAGPELKKNGFINLLDTEYKDKITSPRDAPLGSVLVYEGYGPRRDRSYRHGHIEVRTPNGFMSDYFSTNPRTGDSLIGRNRRLIGVFIKPAGEIPALASLESQGRKNETTN